MSSNIKKNQNKTFEDVTEFHGHVCPGSALGFKAASLALKELSTSQSEDEELVCIVENDSCAVDAIQVMTGCTFGKGNLIFDDYGKQVYTILKRENNEGVRVSIKKSFSMDQIDPELSQLRKKIASGDASPEEKELLHKKVKAVSDKVLEIDEKEIFEAEKVKIDLPPKASIFKSVECDKCREMVSEHRLKEMNGNKVCIPCFEAENQKGI